MQEEIREQHWDPEDLARVLHEWYLEATKQEGAEYNPDAAKHFDDLPEGSKMLDRYIATKVKGMLEKALQAQREGIVECLKKHSFLASSYELRMILEDDALKCINLINNK